MLCIWDRPAYSIHVMPKERCITLTDSITQTITLENSTSKPMMNVEQLNKRFNARFRSIAHIAQVIDPIDINLHRARTSEVIEF